jgi:hypothetical protein
MWWRRFRINFAGRKWDIGGDLFADRDGNTNGRYFAKRKANFDSAIT